VTDVDLIMSYWAGEPIAHTITSFGFDNAQRLTFSIETRKQNHEGYSSIAGFFKQYELAIVTADERDVVRVRSNIRGEDVRIYRLRMTPKNTRLLLPEHVDELNELARQPRFYNTLTANCTVLVFDMVRVIHPGLPLDIRVLLSGYLPSYAYDLGATDTSISFEMLRALAKIHDKAMQADADPLFSVRIREGCLCLINAGAFPPSGRRESPCPTPKMAFLSHSCGEGSSRAQGTGRLTSSRHQEKHRPLPFILESRPCRDLLVRWTPLFDMRKRETQPQQQIKVRRQRAVLLDHALGEPVRAARSFAKVAVDGPCLMAIHAD